MDEKPGKRTMELRYIILLVLLGCAATALTVVNLNSHGNSSRPALASSSNSSNNSLSPSDLRHGDMQVQSMIQDRPAMKTYVRRGDEICDWAARQFAGQGLGERVYWDRSPPTKGVRGMNKYIGQRHTIRISPSEVDGTPLTGEQLWAIAVFELYNTHIRCRWAEMDADAKLGKISKQEWMKTAQQLEFQSAISTKSFFYAVWIPHLKKLGIPQDLHSSSTWKVDLPDSFEEFLKQSSSYSEYLYHLEHTFDTQVAPKIIQP